MDRIAEGLSRVKLEHAIPAASFKAPAAKPPPTFEKHPMEKKAKIVEGFKAAAKTLVTQHEISQSTPSNASKGRGQQGLTKVREGETQPASAMEIARRQKPHNQAY